MFFFNNIVQLVKKINQFYSYGDIIHIFLLLPVQNLRKFNEKNCFIKKKCKFQVIVFFSI